MMCIILLKVVINGYCLKNKGIKEERIMEKKYQEVHSYYLRYV